MDFRHYAEATSLPDSGLRLSALAADLILAMLLLSAALPPGQTDSHLRPVRLCTYLGVAAVLALLLDQTVLREVAPPLVAFAGTLHATRNIWLHCIASVLLILCWPVDAGWGLVPWRDWHGIGLALAYYPTVALALPYVLVLIVHGVASLEKRSDRDESLGTPPGTLT